MTQEFEPPLQTKLHCELLKRGLDTDWAIVQPMTPDRLRQFTMEQCLKKVRLLEEELAAHKAGFANFERDQQELIRQFEELIKEHMAMRSRLDNARAMCCTFPNFDGMEVEP